jgi:hypothetical protein
VAHFPLTRYSDYSIRLCKRKTSHHDCITCHINYFIKGERAMVTKKIGEIAMIEELPESTT